MAASGEEVTTFNPESREVWEGERGDIGGWDIEPSAAALAASGDTPLLRLLSAFGGLAGEFEEVALDVPGSSQAQPAAYKADNARTRQLQARSCRIQVARPVHFGIDCCELRTALPWLRFNSVRFDYACVLTDLDVDAATNALYAGPV